MTDWLEQVRARDLAATPGPWYTFGLPWFRDGAGVLAGSPDPHTGRVIADCDPMEFMDEPDRANPRQQEDAEFIAEARSDVPRLLKLVEELRRERDDLASRLADMAVAFADAKAEQEELRR